MKKIFILMIVLASGFSISAKDNLSNDSITLPKGNIITPQNLLLCESGINFQLTANYSSTYFFRWKNDFGTVVLEGIGETVFENNIEGIYYLEISTDGTGTPIDYDTARVFTLDVFFYYSGQSLLSIGQSSSFEVALVPSVSLLLDYTNIEYIWNFGDGTSDVSTVDNNTIEHIFHNYGNYDISLTVSIGGCNYYYAENFYVRDTSVASITPRNSYLCKDDDYTTLNVNLSPASLSIFHKKYDFLFGASEEEIAELTNEVDVYLPGMYYFRDYEHTSLISDTAFVDYNVCDDFSAVLYVNDGTDYVNCISGNNVKFKTEVSLGSSVCANLDEYYFIWDLGDGNVEEDYNLTELEHNYETSGNYVVSLYIIDSKKCEKFLRKKLSVFTNASDTVYIDYGQLPSDDIVVDFKNYEQAYIDYKANSQFMSRVDDKIIPYNYKRYTLEVNDAVYDKIGSASDVTFYTNFTSIGDMKFELQTPSGTVIQLLNNEDNPLDGARLYGHPAFYWTSYDQGFPNSYFFNVDANESIETALGDEYYYYFSPDKIYADEYIDFLPTGNYKSEAMYNLVDEPISGTWSLIVEARYPSLSYGKFISWGLIFDKSYYYMSILPDSLVCSDQFGTKYDVYNNQIEIKNSAVTDYYLSCKMRYDVSTCELNKNIVVSMPDGPIVPEYFSPNNDGINDYWLPVSPEVEAKVIIVDKSGRIVADYVTTDKPEGWDGKYNGKELLSDSYWYILTLQNNQIVKGVITIVR